MYQAAMTIATISIYNATIRVVKSLPRLHSTLADTVYCYSYYYSSYSDGDNQFCFAGLILLYLILLG